MLTLLTLCGSHGLSAEPKKVRVKTPPTKVGHRDPLDFKSLINMALNVMPISYLEGWGVVWPREHRNLIYGSIAKGQKSKNH